MNFKTTDWFIKRFGTQSATQSTPKSVTPGVYGLSIPNEDSIETESNSEFFLNKLKEKGLSYSITTRPERIVGTPSRSFTQSFAETFRAKLSEPNPTHDVANDYKKMPFMNGNKGLTASHFNFASIRSATASASIETKKPSKLVDMKAKFAAEPAANMSAKKFYTKVADNTPKLDKKAFVEFVALVSDITKDKATSLIKNNGVTVNNNLVTDVKYELNIGDLVRVGIEGHYMNNNKGIAIVK